MAALVQTYPQQTGTVTMLQTRPSSNSGMMSPSQQHANHQFMGSHPHPLRSPYQGTGSSGYRGNTAPVQPYAFTSTPNLNQTTTWQQFGSYRAVSSPPPAGLQPYDLHANHRTPASSGLPPTNAAYSHSFGVSHGGSRDDLALSMNRNTIPASRSQALLAGSTQSTLSSGAPGRNAPDRYRRTNSGNLHSRSQSATLPSSMSMLNIQQSYAAQANPRYSAPNFGGGRGLAAVSSCDDMHLHNRSLQEDGRRMRRRSMHTIDLPNTSKSSLSPTDALRSDKDPKSPRLSPRAATHSRSVSSESVSSTRSSHSRHSSVSYLASAADSDHMSQEGCKFDRY